MLLIAWLYTDLKVVYLRKMLLFLVWANSSSGHSNNVNNKFLVLASGPTKCIEKKVAEPAE